MFWGVHSVLLSNRGSAAGTPGAGCPAPNRGMAIWAPRAVIGEPLWLHAEFDPNLPNSAVLYFLMSHAYAGKPGRVTVQSFPPFMCSITELDPSRMEKFGVFTSFGVSPGTGLESTVLMDSSSYSYVSAGAAGQIPFLAPNVGSSFATLPSGVLGAAVMDFGTSYYASNSLRISPVAQW